MGAFIVVVLIFIALMKLPRVTTAAAFTMVAFMFVEEGVLLRGLPQLFMFSAMLTVALQLSPSIGGIRAIKSHIKFSLKRLIKQVLISFLIIVVGLAVTILTCLFMRYVVMPHAEIVGFLLILLIGPAIGFAVASLVKAFADEIWGSDEEIEEGHRQQKLEAERKRQEAERQRLAAERAAAQKRLDLACENMKGLWQKALSTYGERDGGKIGARGFGISGPHYRSLPDSVLYKRLGVDPTMVPMYFSVDYTHHDAKPVPTQIWVTNEQRTKAIDNILKNADIILTDNPFRSNPQSIHIPGAEDEARPWLWYIEHTLNFFYPAMNKEYLDEIAPIKKYYDGEYATIKAGLDGEAYIKRALDMHNDEYYVLYDLRLELPGPSGENESVETDALVIAPNGIFAIEIKNYGSTGSYKLVVTADGQWYKELQNGKRESIPNPVAQNDRHIAFLSKFINRLLGRDMMNRAAIENIIAIANDSVDIDVYPGAPLTVTRAGNLYGCIMADRTQKFTLDELQLLKKELERAALPAKPYPLGDYTECIKWVVKQQEILCHSAAILNRAAKEHPEWFAAL